MSRIAECQLSCSKSHAETLRRKIIHSLNWARVPNTKSAALRHLFQGNLMTHLEVDGFNFGKRLWAWLFPGLDVNDLTDDEFNRLMDDVIGLITWLCYQTECCTATVVFDGPSGSFDKVNDRVTVEFSGGYGQDRADMTILRHLDNQLDCAEYDSIAVITDDCDLRYEVRELGAKLLRSVELCHLLKWGVSA